jgi:hypothetical protein
MVKHKNASSGSAEILCENLQPIDFLKLPSVSVENRKNLPNECGVYFVIDSTDVLQYVGHSGSIRCRLLNHSLFPALKTKNLNLRIAYLVCPNAKHLARIYEAVLIEFYNPPMNSRSYPRLLERSMNTIELQFDSKIVSKLIVTKPIALSLESWKRLKDSATKLGFDSIESFLENLSLRD